jgi:tetratricopeptide (TPR) repeat protein
MAKKMRNDREGMDTRQQRDLDIEIGFLEGLVRRDPANIEALKILGDDYTRRGRYGEGLGIDLQLVDLRPEEPLTHYNLACSHALLEQWEPAVRALHRALDRGFRDFRWLSRDPDLRRLRRRTIFQTIRQRIRTLQGESV